MVPFTIIGKGSFSSRDGFTGFNCRQLKVDVSYNAGNKYFCRIGGSDTVIEKDTLADALAWAAVILSEIK